MYNLAMLHGASNPQLGLSLNDFKPSVLKRKTKNAYKKAKKAVVKVADDVGLDRVGDFAETVYKYSGTKNLVELAGNTWDAALNLMEDYIWEPVKEAAFEFIKEKLIDKYGDELIKVPIATVVGYGTVISAKLIAFLNLTFPGYGALISTGVPPLVTALTYAVVEEVKEKAVNAGKKVKREASDFLNDILNDESKHAELILAAMSPEDKLNMSTKAEEAREAVAYQLAKAGIPAPNKITVETVQVTNQMTGQKMNQSTTLLSYYSQGKTYRSSLSPEQWIETYIKNNPKNKIAVQPNGLVIKVMPTPTSVLTAKSLDNLNYSMAKPGITPPNKITVETVQITNQMTGQKTNQNTTILHYYSQGKTYRSSLSPDNWLQTFKANNPQYANVYKNSAGLIINPPPVAMTTPGSYPGGGGGGGGGTSTTTTASPEKSKLPLILAAAAAALLLT